MGFNIQRTGRVFTVAERCVRRGFSGEVCRRVGVEERPFLKNQNEKRGGFYDE